MLTAYTSNKQDTRQARLRRFVRHSQLKRYSEVSTYDHLTGLNHPELVQKHPTHLARAVLVWFV